VLHDFPSRYGKNGGGLWFLDSFSFWSILTPLRPPLLSGYQSRATRKYDCFLHGIQMAMSPFPLRMVLGRCGEQNQEGPPDSSAWTYLFSRNPDVFGTVLMLRSFRWSYPVRCSPAGGGSPRARGRFPHLFLVFSHPLHLLMVDCSVAHFGAPVLFRFFPQAVPGAAV